MKPWYNNYCFSTRSLNDEPMYNSDMVLYYMSYILRTGNPPEEMIDQNIRTDYTKLRYLIKLDKKLGQNFSIIREFIDGEAHIKGFLLAYTGLLNYYTILPEYELGKGYVDFLFQPNLHFAEAPYAYLLEVKYMKRDEPENRIATLKKDARAQLLKHAADDYITSLIDKAELKLITVIFRGWELAGMEEVSV